MKTGFTCYEKFINGPINPFYFGREIQTEKRRF